MTTVNKIEIGLMVILIGILLYFHFKEKEGQNEVIEILKQIRDKKS